MWKMDLSGHIEGTYKIQKKPKLCINHAVTISQNIVELCGYSFRLYINEVQPE